MPLLQESGCVGGVCETRVPDDQGGLLNMDAATTGVGREELRGRILSPDAPRPTDSHT